MRNRDKMKDDAIAQLSDQLLAISARLQELERKQQTVTLTNLIVDTYEMVCIAS
jgi:hypothetical protein